MPKTMIAFSSQQVLPNYIAVRQVQPERVVMMTTEEYSHVPARLMQTTGIPHRARPIAAYDLPEALAAVQNAFADTPKTDDVILNVTGGTKIMSLAGVLSGMSSTLRDRAKLVYVDTRNQDLHQIQLKAGGQMGVTREPIDVSIPFATFVLLAGETLNSKDSPDGIPDERYRVGRRLANDAALTKLFDGHTQSHMKDLEDKGVVEGSLELSMGNRRRGSWHIAWKKGRGRISLPGEDDMTFDSNDPLGFFRGGWLEEYVARLMSHSGRFDEVFHNAVVQLRQPIEVGYGRKRTLFTDKNELDVVVTKGPRAAIIECKAGSVRQDHIHKLAALRNHLLGPFGKAVLACRFRPGGHTKSVIERAEDEDITIVAQDDLAMIADMVDAELRKGVQ